MKELSQIKLDTVTDSIVFKRQLILERSFTLPFQKDLMRLATNPRGHLCFEELYKNVSKSQNCEQGAES